ncbi:hypothetical protein [Streptomyces sp. NRRL S-1813]|uniref:hypothetical protein n=1 Tax=Streptomyces sp. NRRL S-1813 TaxID=1463888 RepID=UPI0004C9A8E3|nr:hypothetical protein [Streptomyces sp. NRRL S-1813]
MDEQRVRQAVDAVVGQLRTYVPDMAPYFEDDRPLGEYAKALSPTSGVAPEHAERQELIATCVRRVLRRAFGPGGPADAVTARDIRAVNIVDHHQVLNHPLLLGTNIIANAGRLLSDGPAAPIVTLSCSNVNPSNHYMRNGFRFRGVDIPYFSAKEHRDVMYYLRPRTFDFVQRLHSLKRWSGFAPADQDFLEEYQHLLNGLDHSASPGHRDQLATVVHGTWPRLFSEELRPRLPDLLYAGAEDVARESLIELLAEESYLSEALLDPVPRQRVLDTFRGVVVAWDEAAGKGTHFFWMRHPGRPGLLRLYVQGGELVPADPRFAHLRVPLERDALREALHREDLVPSVALYMTLLLFAGIKPLVGPGSLVYTTQLKNGWQALLDRHGPAREARLIEEVDVTGMIAGTPVFFERAGETLTTLYAADVMSKGGVDETYVNSVLRTPFKDVLSVGSSGVYDLFSNSYIPKEQQLTERIGFDEAATFVHDWV